MLGRRILAKTISVLRIFKRNFLKIMLLVVFSCLFYWVVNDLFIEISLVPDANKLMAKKSYNKAAGRYGLAHIYYGFNHFTKNTRDKYFAIAYKESVALLLQNKKKEAYKNILETSKNIQWDYGMYSKENAFFIRKYLINFYLLDNNITLANEAYKNLIAIYRVVGYSNSEVADVMRCAGDIYFAGGHYFQAFDFYSKGYGIIMNEKKPDYEILQNMTNRIALSKIKLKMDAEAIDLYVHAIAVVRQSYQAQETILVDLLVNLGDLYSKNEEETGKAVECYAEVVEKAQKMPKTTEARQNLEEYKTTLKNLRAKYDFTNKINSTTALPADNKK